MAGIILCAGIHFLLDCIVPLMIYTGVSIWIAEGLLMAVAGLSIVFIRLSRNKFPVKNPYTDPAIKALEEGY